MDDQPKSESPLTDEEIRELRSLLHYFRRKRERDEMVKRLKENPLESRLRARNQYGRED